jgi:hypothetical protein
MMGLEGVALVGLAYEILRPGSTSLERAGHRINGTVNGVV